MSELSLIAAPMAGFRIFDEGWIAVIRPVGLRYFGISIRQKFPSSRRVLSMSLRRR